MERNANERSLQHEGAEALVGLINHHPYNQDRVVEAMGLKVISATMMHYGNDREICLRGVRLLANITWSNSAIQKDNDTCTITTTTLCKVMALFPTDRNLQLYGCRGLANMAADLSHHHQTFIGTSGGCELAISALHYYTEDRDVTWFALGAVANLALNNR